MATLEFLKEFEIDKIIKVYFEQKKSNVPLKYRHIIRICTTPEALRNFFKKKNYFLLKFFLKLFYKKNCCFLTYKVLNQKTQF